MEVVKGGAQCGADVKVVDYKCECCILCVVLEDATGERLCIYVFAKVLFELYVYHDTSLREPVHLLPYSGHYVTDYSVVILVYNFLCFFNTGMQVYWHPITRVPRYKYLISMVSYLHLIVWLRCNFIVVKYTVGMARGCCIRCGCLIWSIKPFFFSEYGLWQFYGCMLPFCVLTSGRGEQRRLCWFPSVCRYQLVALVDQS